MQSDKIHKINKLISSRSVNINEALLCEQPKATPHAKPQLSFALFSCTDNIFLVFASTTNLESFALYMTFAFRYLLRQVKGK